MSRAGAVLLVLMSSAAPLLAQYRETGLVLVAESLATEPGYNPGVEFAAPNPPSVGRVPERVDLRWLLPPVGSQGKQRSCVAWVLAYAIVSYYQNLKTERPFGKSVPPNPQAVFSPAYLYNRINGGVDQGASFPAAFERLLRAGSVPWAVMPYDSMDYKAAPPQGADSIASQYRIGGVRQLGFPFSPAYIEAELAARNPVIIGMAINPRVEPDTDGVWRLHRDSSTQYHAMLIVGYRQAERRFLLMNSWGAGWGIGGYAWIDYGLLQRLVVRAYVIKES